MSDRHESYVSPLETRYASPAMRELLSAQRKHATWRRLWLALAEAQQQLGLDITDAQLDQMRQHLDDIDFAAAGAYEGRLRHDVMAHIHAFGDVAPAARPIMHLGATSQFVNDNADAVIHRQALDMLAGKTACVIDQLARFARQWKELPCLAFTHFQPAQLTTVGKRAIVWCADFLRDLHELARRRDGLEFRGCKGTTGTQASYLALFDGNHEKVRRLDRLVAEKMGFDRLAPVTGQTTTRKVDAEIAQTLAGVGVSVHKLANDVRLLAHRKELEEPFGREQVGSSAMAYKRNPMRCERATALARLLIDLAASPVHTAAEQWLERSLDDSANKRIALAEGFLLADSILEITLNVTAGLVVYPAVIQAAVRSELPFMATENILMSAVKAGGDRQDLHERIRQHSQAAAEQIKGQGLPNDLIDRIKADPAFADIDIESLLAPDDFVGRAPQQVEEFIEQHVQPIRNQYRNALGQDGEVNV